MLIIDNHTAFVGGMNIGDRHLVQLEPNPKRVADLHFVARGPIVAQVEQLFIRDWEFASGERLETMGELPEAAGECACRCISDGPDEDIDRLVGVLLASIGAARERVWVMTPYFLPPRELIGALQAAALQGLDVAVILPEENNLPYVHRATRHMLWEPIRRGVQVYYQPPPFVHSKVLIIDDAYAQVGSANWDARSLRLNFELALEIFGCAAVEDLALRFAKTRAASTRVVLSDLEARQLPTRLVDGAAWLMSPYL